MSRPSRVGPPKCPQPSLSIKLRTESAQMNADLTGLAFHSTQSLILSLDLAALDLLMCSWTSADNRCLPRTQGKAMLYIFQ